MSKKTAIINARLVMPASIVEGGVILADGKISEILDSDCERDLSGIEIVDAGGLYLSPGFIDIHTHGAGGHDFMDGTPDCMKKAVMMQLSHGATGVVPTTLSASFEETLQVIDTFKKTRETLAGGPNLLGLHLEGPYFNVKQCGAQDPRFIKAPDKEEYERIIEEADGAIKIWSVAPELEGAIEMGRYLRSKGIVGSIGHSDATYDKVMEAFENGFTNATHLYSAMSTITRKDGYRKLGIIEAAYLLDDMTVEIIADGCHLPPELIQYIYKGKGPDRICLVTDSMRGAGMPDGKSILGSLKNGMEVKIVNGVAKLLDDSGFAGSVATCDRLVRVIVKQCGISLSDAVKMASATPAKTLGIYDRKGSIAVEKDADLILFNDEIEIQSVYVMGEKVYIAHDSKE